MIYTGLCPRILMVRMMVIITAWVYAPLSRRCCPAVVVVHLVAYVNLRTFIFVTL